MFHFGVIESVKDIKLIPVWFNEALAYYIGENTLIDPENIKFIVCNQNKIISMLQNDDVLEKSPQGFEIIKSFGAYFSSIYTPETVKSILFSTNKRGNFNSAIKKCTGKDIKIILKGWFEYLNSG